MQRLLFAASVVLTMLAPLSGVRAAAAGDTVRVPLPHGVSLAVPKGWVACDPAVDALLGGKAPENNVEDLCKPSAGIMQVAFANPDLSTLMVVGVGYDKDLHFVDPSTAAPAELDAFKTKLCKTALEEEAGNGRCEFKASMLAGHATLDGLLTTVTHDGMDCTARIVAFSRDGGTMLIMAMTFPKLASGGLPLFDTAIASAAFE